jgi:hypothetical protein
VSDYIIWDFILELLQHCGFPSWFRNWITIFLSTTSSQVLLNDIVGLPTMHGCGLHQGDPYHLYSLW